MGGGVVNTNNVAHFKPSGYELKIVITAGTKELHKYAERPSVKVNNGEALKGYNLSSKKDEYRTTVKEANDYAITISYKVNESDEEITKTFNWKMYPEVRFDSLTGTSLPEVDGIGCCLVNKTTPETITFTLTGSGFNVPGVELDILFTNIYQNKKEFYRTDFKIISDTQATVTVEMSPLLTEEIKEKGAQLEVTAGLKGTSNDRKTLDKLIRIAGKTKILKVIPPHHNASGILHNPCKIILYGENLDGLDLNNLKVSIADGEGNYTPVDSSSDLSYKPKDIKLLKEGRFTGYMFNTLTIANNSTSHKDRDLRGGKLKLEHTIDGHTDTFDVDLSQAIVNELSKLTGWDGDVQVNPDGIAVANIPNYVETIGSNAFRSNSSRVQVINVPKEVTEIGEKAFHNLTNLEKVNLEDSKPGDNPYTPLRKIGRQAFFRCPKLNDVVIPSTVTNIGQEAFAECSGLNKITFTSGEDIQLGSGVFKKTGFTKLTISGRIKNLADGTFQECNVLDEVDMEKGVESISSTAFSKCNALQRLNISNTVNFIGRNAFTNLNNLVNVNFAEGNDQVKLKLEEGVFSNLSNLSTINIPARVEELPSKTFENCKMLSEVILNEGLRTISGTAFNNKCESLESIRIPSTVVSIGEQAFMDIPRLATIEFVPGEYELNIGKAAFVNLTGLKSITLPKRLVKVPDKMLRGCTALTSVVIEEGVREIGNSVFGRAGLTGDKVCENLSSVTIPLSVEHIGDYAFKGCEKLKNITIEDGETPLSLGAEVFMSLSALEEITLPGRIHTIPTKTFRNCKSLVNVTMKEGIKKIGAEVFGKTGNVVLSNNGSILGIHDICSSLKTIKLPSSLESIEASAFGYCVQLSEIIIPSKVSVISPNAFEGCVKLTSVVLEEGVKEIGQKAFANTGVETIITPKSITKVCESAFSECTNLKTVDMRASETLEIEKWAFWSRRQNDSKLLHVVLPGQVTSVGQDAFKNIRTICNFYIPNEIYDVTTNDLWNILTNNTGINRAQIKPYSKYGTTP